MGIAGLLMAAAASAFAAAPPPPPVEAYAHDPMAAALELSPDGQTVAYLAPYGGVQHIVIRPLLAGANEQPVIIPPGDFQFTGLDWVNNRTLIFSVIGRDTIQSSGLARRSPVRFSRLGAVEKDGSNLRVLYEPKVEGARYSWSSGSILQFIDDDHVMIAVPDDRSQLVGKLNVYTGRLERIDRIRRTGLSFYPDPSGQLRLATRFDDKTKTQVFMYRKGIGEDFKEISKVILDAEEEFVPLGFGDNDTLYVASNHESNTTAVYTFDLATESFIEKVQSDERFDAGGVIRERGKIIGLTYTRDMPVATYFDPAIQRLQTALDKAVPDSTELIINYRAGSRFVVVASHHPQAPLAYMIFDKETKELIPFADTFPNIPIEAIGHRKPISYKARDGVELHGYLTLPPGKEPRNLPFIVLPHGGPIARDTQSFDTLSQFLVSRGYAVLQPNFRGSAGFGKSFVMAGRGEWGGKMQSDVTDGALWAVEQGIADPDRMCILGWSYGGYAALMGAVQNSDIFKCAVATAPVTNLDRLWKELFWTSAGTDFNRSLFFDGNKDGITDVSPYHQAARIKIPTLLIHGDMDVQAFVQHSRDMVDALKSNGKPHEYIEIKGMDHSPRTTQEMVQILSAWERFLAQHIGN